MSQLALRESFVKAEGRKGTYTTDLGGVGLGYDVGTTETGQVVVNSGGNGYYYPVHGLKSFVADGGKGYMDRVRGLSLPPAYTR